MLPGGPSSVLAARIRTWNLRVKGRLRYPVDSLSSDVDRFLGAFDGEPVWSRRRVSRVFLRAGVVPLSGLRLSH